jgi:hypothetical protein
MRCGGDLTSANGLTRDHGMASFVIGHALQVFSGIRLSVPAFMMSPEWSVNKAGALNWRRYMMRNIVDEVGEIIAKATDDHTLIGGHHRLAVAASHGRKLFWKDTGELPAAIAAYALNWLCSCAKRRAILDRQFHARFPQRGLPKKACFTSKFFPLRWGP